MGAFLQCGSRVIDLSGPVVMGIVNVTPDSFSDGGCYFDAGRLQLDLVLKQVEAMVADGAAIVDVGGESTRPGAASVSLEEECRRVLPVVEAIVANVDVTVSVDTSSPEVMVEVGRLGAGMINDVRALGRPGAIEAVAASDMAVCLMHMQGSPAHMQDSPSYDDVLSDVVRFLSARVDACRQMGIADARICVDPGFGFGKTLEDNLQLLANLKSLDVAGLPWLVGMSRKSMIGGVLGSAIPDRLAGSLAAAVLAVVNGARIIRVHDVKPTADAVRMAAAVLREVRA